MAERSRAYPGVSLEKAVEFVIRVFNTLGSSEFNRHDIGQALGLSEGTIIRPVAALVHFGMIDRIGGSEYQITSLGRQLADPVDEQEFASSLVEAVLQPTLFREIVEKFKHEGRVPHRLDALLHRSFGITSKAAPLAADIFVQSARYAGLIDAKLHFNVGIPKVLSSGASELPPAAQGDSTESVPEFAGPSQLPATLPVGQLARAHGDADHQDFYFRLSGGKFAHLRVPASLTTKDMAILEKQLELLHLQIEDD